MSARKQTTRRALRSWAAAALAVALIWSALALYSISERGSVPVGASKPLQPSVGFTGGIEGGHATSLAPFMDVVPSLDGRELYVRAGGTGELGGTVYASLGVGPGHHKGGWTMVYSDVVRSYVAALAQSLSTMLYYVFLLTGFSRRR